MPRILTSVLGCCLACLTACCTLPDTDDCFVEAVVRERLDLCEDILIQQPLSVESAVQLALLNNPRIQALFEEIGIAQADLIEAGLLSNPIFEAIVRYPDRSGFMTNPEYSLIQNFVDLLLLPIRKKIAAAEYEKVKYSVAHAVLTTAFEVQKVYYSLVAAQMKRDLLKNIVELAEIANEIAIAQRNQGNVNALALQIRTSEYLRRLGEIGEAEAEIIHQRESLNKLLGLAYSDICMAVPSSLPDITSEEPNFDCLEQVAFEERLDLQAAKWEVVRYNRMFPTVQWWTFTNLAVGVSSTREPSRGSPWTTGPALTGAIPIFNYGQGARKRLWAQFRQASQRLAALEIDAYAEVREARDTLLVYREQILLYKNQIIPKQQEVVNSTEELYNIMSAGIYELLDAKRIEFTTTLDYQMMLKNYWLAKVALNEAVGGVIP